MSEKTHPDSSVRSARGRQRWRDIALNVAEKLTLFLIFPIIVKCTADHSHSAHDHEHHGEEHAHAHDHDMKEEHGHSESAHAHEHQEHSHEHGHKHAHDETKDEMPAWKKKALEGGASDHMAAPFGGEWTTESNLSAKDHKMED